MTGCLSRDADDTASPVTAGTDAASPGTGGRALDRLVTVVCDGSVAGRADPHSAAARR